MPKVGKKHFPYTEEGYKEAEKEKRRQGLKKKAGDKKGAK